MALRLSFLCIFIFASTLLHSQNIYISPTGNDRGVGSINDPVKTIERANELVKILINFPGIKTINVFLRGGVYFLDKPVIFDNTISPKLGNSVVYSSYPGEIAVISGGKQIKDWTNYTNKIIKANVGKFRFRQLYLNGTRCIRAREPNFCNYNRLLSYNFHTKSISINAFDLPKIKSSSSEVVLQKHWNIDILRIKDTSKDDSIGFLFFKNPEISRTFNQKYPSKEVGQTYHFENDQNFIDYPSEWSLSYDTGIVYFYPHVDSYKRSSKIEIPILEKLFIIKGTPKNPVRNLVIKNLIFELTNWDLPFYTGYNGIQAGVINVASKYQPTPSAIFIQDSENILILENHLRNLGGHGLIVYSGTKNCKVEGNVFSDIAANAVNIAFDLEGEKHLIEKLTHEVCSNITLSNNYITRAGLDYYGSVGIFVGYASDIKITNNFLEDLPYTGISIGWGWSNEISSIRNIIIRNNLINRVMKKLDDGAGIYLLSNQPGTIVENNTITNIVKSEWAGPTDIFGIYLDEGSDNISVKNNSLDSLTKIWISPSAGENNLIINSNDNTTLNVGLSEKYSFIINKAKEKPSNYILDYNCQALLTIEKSIVNKIFIISPNPAKDNFKISIPYNFSDNYLKITMYSSKNNIVYSKKFLLQEIVNNEIPIVQNLLPGVYSIVLKSQTNLFVKKIIVL